ncbi:hypothetical protein D7B24_008629 [Verticillium nonalfalfae]|uniref:DUF4396 domain-containing protein n=1 Tax=Verticillium nonalfalfae TaxID=1051616 RepID=A0A3M9YL21_9PEZI|nr:uncharacterized protein D7B24_008629 [Verticillium nonalfalfae]RNJ60248.1 hypothetical protein D7B24_008629 [Verticillium nonalfalfae]
MKQRNLRISRLHLVVPDQRATICRIPPHASARLDAGRINIEETPAMAFPRTSTMSSHCWSRLGTNRIGSVVLPMASRHRAASTKSSSHASSPASPPSPSTCPPKPCSKATPSPTSLEFWSSPSTWRRAGLNTTRCLVGCTFGDFSAMWFLQSFHPELGTGAIMAIAMASGLASSMTLETVLLRLGRDRLSWGVAARTAAGMSLLSMLTMEAASNAVDFHLTGGQVRFDDPAFWVAAVVAMGAGFLAPLPYNYLRLRKYGKACH